MRRPARTYVARSWQRAVTRGVAESYGLAFLVHVKDEVAPFGYNCCVKDCTGLSSVKDDAWAGGLRSGNIGKLGTTNSTGNLLAPRPLTPRAAPSPHASAHCQDTIARACAGVTRVRNHYTCNPMHASAYKAAGLVWDSKTRVQTVLTLARGMAGDADQIPSSLAIVDQIAGEPTKSPPHPSRLARFVQASVPGTWGAWPWKTVETTSDDPLQLLSLEATARAHGLQCEALRAAGEAMRHVGEALTRLLSNERLLSGIPRDVCWWLLVEDETRVLKKAMRRAQGWREARAGREVVLVVRGDSIVFECKEI